MTTEQLFDMGILDTVKDLRLYSLLILAHAREIMKKQNLSGFQKVVDKGAEWEMMGFEYPYVLNTRTSTKKRFRMVGR